jgi:hypothetical protein
MNTMEILDTKIDLRANSRLLFGEYREYFHWILITAMLDVASTMWFMQVVGPQIEINPIIRLLSYSLGIVLGPLIGKSAQLFAIWALTLIAPRLTRHLCLLIIMLNSMACLLNTGTVVANL